jgi:hypothetical protein
MFQACSALLFCFFSFILIRALYGLYDLRSTVSTVVKPLFWRVLDCHSNLPTLSIGTWKALLSYIPVLDQGLHCRPVRCFHLLLKTNWMILTESKLQRYTDRCGPSIS